MAKITRPAKKMIPGRPGKTSSQARLKPAVRKPASKTRRRSSPVAKRMTRRSRPGGWSWGSISNERKIDVLGVAMALVGLLTLLSLLSREQGQATGLWIVLMGQLAGSGAFVLPVALILVGLWLVFRNIDRLPLLSLERILGLALLYLNILAFLHLVTGGNYGSAAEGQGGGYIGAFFAWMLTLGFGLAGAYVAVAAWFLIALAFTLDISISELFRSPGV
ncbi:MAG TPA: DNA translocase FtsK 4TM domain-containing protein, partial [Levilinea sp.]|nr:DNA translocase FtsK 4TM domain-containing protein [Levilinea sp.]